MASPSIHNNAVPSEVGWQFVPQYYTYMNKQPNNLHRFYTKNSTFIHGTEGEDVKPCNGQQEIHNKILSVGFTDCKVFIHSVDAQSSANNGIIIQVIGEMSNRGEAWRKFVQTFFLAEQPNGYFVLNDIFRYLKEEAVDTEELEVDAVPAAGAEQVPPTQEEAPASVDVPAVESTVEEAETATQPAEEAVEEPSKLNGIHHEQEVPEPVTTVVEPEPEELVTQLEPEHEAVPVPEVQSKTPEPAPEPVLPVASTPAVPPPQPAAPPAPKTWANLAAANSNKWGNAVAQEAKGVSAAAAPSVSPAPSGASTPARDGGSRGPRDNHSPAYQAALAVSTAQCFVKGVTEVVSQAALTSTLTSRFGAVKEAEIVRTKACAFLEFVSVESARKAIIASLPPNQGGEGGIRIDAGEAGQVRINVETKKERGERPPPRPRGGAVPNGDARGSFRGGRGGGSDRGRGRGGPPKA